MTVGRELYGSVERLIAEMLGREGDDLPPQLLAASDRSREVAEAALEVDRIAHGDVDEKLIPDAEGRKRVALHIRYERSPRNRRWAIQIHGTVCKACGFDFDEVYGPDHAGSYIEIHHVEPLADYEGEVDPITGLVPLCANCHRMVHRDKEPVMSVKELRNLLKARGFVER